MITKPSNPFRRPGSGWSGEPYTYPINPDHKLFYVCGQTDHWIPISTICFALSEEDAIAKLIEGLKHSHPDVEITERNEEVRSLLQAHQKQALAIIYGKSELTITAVEVKPNQFFKVGWADNDSIF